MNDLVPVERKLVNFNGAEIMAVKCSNGKIYAGVKWVCNGLDFDDRKQRAEVERMTKDIVLMKGIQKIGLPTSGGIQDVTCLELDFLPLWLAKINANIIDNPDIQERLVDYQLHTKDVLAGAFLRKKSTALPAWDKIAIGEIRFAKEFAKAVGIRPERAVAVALARIEKETGKQLGDYRRTLPAVNEEDAELLTPGQIGERYGIKANQVNLLLEEIGLQYGIREAGKAPGRYRLIKRNPWQLTERGKEWGIMQDSAKQSSGGNKWEGFQIFWSVKTVDVVRDLLAQKAALVVEGGGNHA